MYTKGMFVPEKWDDSLIGRKVERSSNWTWQDQDGGPGNIGEIIDFGIEGWVRVIWPNGYTDSYPADNLIFADNGQINSVSTPTLDFDKDNFVVEAITKEDGPKAIEFIKSLGIDTKNYLGTCYKDKWADDAYFYGCFHGIFDNFTKLFVSSNKIKVVRYPGQTSHLPQLPKSEKNSQKVVTDTDELLEFAEAVREMQKYIPGFYIGCTLKIVKPTGFSQAQIGRTFTTQGLTTSELKKALELFSTGQDTCRLDPNNIYEANYFPEDLKVVDPKEDYHVTLTPRAEAVMEMYAKDYPLTLRDCLVPSGFIMGIDPYLPEEESKDKSDSSFEIEFVNSQLRKSGKKSKINF